MSPVLGSVVIELHILIVGNVGQAPAGYRLFVLDWSSGRVGILRYLERKKKYETFYYEAMAEACFRLKCFY